MPDCPAQLQIDHSKEIARLQARVDDHDKVYDLGKDVHNVLIQIASDNSQTVTILEHLSVNQEKMSDEVAAIKEVMASQDSLNKIETKLETFEGRLTEVENKPAKEALEEKKQIRWTIIAFVILAVLTLFGDKIAALF